MYRILFIGLTLLLIQTASGQTCNSFIPASTPDSQFIINGTEVTDIATGLIWQRCSLGLAGTNCTGTADFFTWPEALQAAESEAMATGKPWRLPNVKELRSIVEEKCFDPAINLVAFPNTFAISYRTSSPSTVQPDRSWFVNFTKGASVSSGTSISNQRVRLVRDGGG